MHATRSPVNSVRQNTLHSCDDDPPGHDPRHVNVADTGTVDRVTTGFDPGREGVAVDGRRTRRTAASARALNVVVADDLWFSDLSVGPTPVGRGRDRYTRRDGGYGPACRT